MVGWKDKFKAIPQSIERKIFEKHERNVRSERSNQKVNITKQELWKEITRKRRGKKLSRK